MTNKIFPQIICAVLAFIAGTAYMHIGTNSAFAAQDAAATSETELFIVLEESLKNSADVDAAIGDLMEETAVESAEEVVDTVADDGTGILATIPKGEDAGDVIETLNGMEGVAYAQPNFRYRMMDTAGEGQLDTNDEYRDAQYYLDGWDPTFQKSCGANVAEAWKLLGGINEENTENEPVIAVLDSGCQTTHHDLADNIDTDHAYDAVTKQQGAQYVKDTSGHGTHVCGIAAGVADNESGIAGASGNHAKVIPVNVFIGRYADTADMVTAFNYLEGLMDTGEVRNLHVINMSLGGYDGPDEHDIALESYINRMRSKDVLTVCAGGNGDDNTGVAYKDKFTYPGDFEGCLCVTSLDSDGTNSSFSDYNMEKDISAPGTGILSTMIDEKAQLGKDVPDEGYKYLDGTSMASPLVAGIAALLWADNSQLTADQVYESIISTAVPVNPAMYDRTGETGSAGAVDAAAAIEYARAQFDTMRENLSNAAITVNANGLVYDGKDKKPSVSITCGGKELTEGKDYILSYRNCVNPGKATVTATGILDFIGTISADYTIAKADISKSDVVLEPGSFQYDGQYHFPEITVTMDGIELKWGKDFAPTALSDCTEAGVHKIRLDGKGNYSGSKTVSYTITGAPVSAIPAETAGTATPKINRKITSGKFTYLVTKEKGTGEVRLVGTTASGKLVIPKSVKYNKKAYLVTSIGRTALNNKRKITAVTVPASVRTIQAKAFAGCRGLKTVTLKTKKLTSKTVKGSLKGSKVSTVKIKVGTKKANKKYIKKYKKVFTKKNCGRKVKIK